MLVEHVQIHIFVDDSSYQIDQFSETHFWSQTRRESHHLFCNHLALRSHWSEAHPVDVQEWGGAYFTVWPSDGILCFPSSHRAVTATIL
jgi:hypothetical protein